MWQWISLIGLISCAQAVTYTREFRMPGVRTDKDDAYLCYGESFASNESYITSFEPIHDEEVTHHMILLACQEPGAETKVWSCDEMSVCKGDATIIFSWAMNAPSFKMPPDTSFPIGTSRFPYLVLQVHYKDASSFSKSSEKRDTSGWKLSMQTTPTKRLAGVYLFVTGGEIRPHGWTVVQTGCLYTGSVPLHPFAFRVHAHSHGTLNEAFVFDQGQKYLIGSKSPQEKQTFYPVENKTLEVLPQDYLVARCNMTNNEGRYIQMGNTRKDEMCNFYMMYSVRLVDSMQLFDPNNQQCFSDGTSALAEELFSPSEFGDEEFDSMDPLIDLYGER